MITLKGITWDHERGYSPLIQTTASFEKENPGIQIQWRKRTLKEFGDFPVEKLAEEYDLLMIDHPFSGEASTKGILADLGKYMSPEAMKVREEQELGKTHRCYRYDGKQMALSADIAAQVAVARDDLMKKYGYELPKTFEELLELGKKSGKMAVPLNSTDIWCVFLSLGSARKGEDFVTEDGIDREAAIWSMEQIFRLSEVVIPGCLDKNPIQIMNQMSETEDIVYAPFCFGYVNYAWRARKQPLMFYNIPLWEGAKTAPILGGVGIAVSGSSQHIESAVKYAEYVTRPDIQTEEYFLSGGQPGQKDAWISMRNNEFTGNFFYNTMETIEHAYLRPRFPGWNVFQEMGGDLLNKALRERWEPQQAVEQLEELFQQHFKNILPEAKRRREMYKYLTLEKQDGIAIVTFMRPEQMNAMNREFMNEIVDAFREANEDNSVKVVLVTGSGKAFMAGADIKEYAAQTDEEFLAFQKKGWELYDEAEKGKKPFIAVVNGYALGGGFEIAAACDLIVASENAQFGLPEVHLGLVPGGGGTQRLIQKIGINRVKEILYFGGKFSAAQMKDWGIVNHVVPADQLMDFAKEWAAKLTRRSPEALAALKELAYLSTCPQELPDRMTKEAECLFHLYHTPFAKAKINDFANK